MRRSLGPWATKSSSGSRSDLGRLPNSLAFRALGSPGSFGVMEIRMEATTVYWGSTGIMENEMESTIVCSRS